MERFISYLKQCDIFKDLTSEQLLLVAGCCRETVLEKGEILFKEGDGGDDLFLLVDGKVEVAKKDPILGKEFPQAVLSRNDLIGEMAFVDQAPRDATIKALEKSKLVAVSLKKPYSPEINEIKIHLKSHIADILTQRLRQENKAAVLAEELKFEHEQARKGLGNLIIHLIALIFIYIYINRLILISKINVISSSIISVPILFIFAVSMFMLIKKNGYPLSLYGLNLHRWQKALWESVLFSLPLFPGIVLFKWVMIQIFPAFHGLSLFHVSAGQAPGEGEIGPWAYAFFIGLYALFVPVQEFIYRGAMQVSFKKFLIGKNTTLQSILISNLPFSLIHLHLSFSLTIFVYFFGLFWGWLFARQQTLVGCCFSHFLIGLWAFFIVGIQDFLIV